jgi:uncharacterized membrane protein YeaQ/YmgE (transglycosylase-associated protein family)
MDAQALIIWPIVGAAAGGLVGMAAKDSGYGLSGDVIAGIVGGLIAGWLLPQTGFVIGNGIVDAVIDAFIGAVILLIVLRLIKRAAKAVIRSVELIVQPDAHDVVGKLGVRGNVAINIGKKDKGA